MKIFNKNGLTFIEVIISTVISVIIFIIIFSFIVDSLNSLNISNKKSQVLSKFYEMYDTIGGFKNNYLLGSLLIDKQITDGNDVFLLRKVDNTEGIIFGIIDKQTMKLETSTLFTTYSDRVFGYKILNTEELSKVLSNSNNAYNISFNDAVFFDTPVRNLQVDYYNSGLILSINIGFLLAYDQNYEGLLWNDIPSSNYEIFKVNFVF